MTVGPLHLVVVSFNDDKVVAEIGKQLGIVRKRGIIRLFDFLYVIKHQDGSLAFKEMSDLSSDEKYQYGGVIKSLIGLVVDEGQALAVGTVAEVPGLASMMMNCIILPIKLRLDNPPFSSYLNIFGRLA